MGYYVQGHGSITIDKNEITSAYKAMCALNQDDSLKRGGRSGGNGPDQNSPRPDGLNYHPARWFSWLDPNYPDTCLTFDKILEQLGFDFTINDNGDVATYDLHYDNKTGQEELFLEAIAPYVISGELEWSGEDGQMWKNVFVDSKMETLVARITYVEVDS